MSSNVTEASSVLGKSIGLGAVAGVVASVAMGVYAMVAKLVQDEGFFTPVHQIATIFVSPRAFEDSFASAQAGEGPWEISLGAVLIGLAIHMMVGAVYGAAFGALVPVLKLVGSALLTVAGVVWGLVVLVVSAFVGLPVAAAVFGVDDVGGGMFAGDNPIADMPELVGWGTFTIEHMVFGLVLGLLYAVSDRQRE